MDDKPGVPLLADLIGSLRGRPLSPAEPKPRRGLFVVFEGGEGAGKSTQVRLLADALRAQGREVLVTREPGATEVGERIRNLLLHEEPASGMTPRAEALLYAADRAHHVAALIRPALARGEVIISDRYVDSSLAYQGAGRTLPVDEVSWLSSWATGGLKPDLTVLLDVDPQVGLARAGGRDADADRIESESDAFHERVRYAFLDIAAADSGRYLVLDANRSPEAIAAVVAERIAELLPPAPDRDAEPADGGTPPAGGGAVAGDDGVPPAAERARPADSAAGPAKPGTGELAEFADAVDELDDPTQPIRGGRA
jgi:dTMP kinase